MMVYTPEQGIDLDMLRRDVRFLKRRYELDEKGKAEGRLIIRCAYEENFLLFLVIHYSSYHCRNETASNVYTTDVITKMLKEEGGTLFDSRSASLGHTLQGGIPSPMDRARAARLSLKCMVFIEKQHEILAAQGGRGKSRTASPDSAAVIVIQGSSIRWVPVKDIVEHADMKNRRGKTAWWTGIKELQESLVGRPELG
jgi:6-phosphofructokinase 1